MTSLLVRFSRERIDGFSFRFRFHRTHEELRGLGDKLRLRTSKTMDRPVSVRRSLQARRRESKFFSFLNRHHCFCTLDTLSVVLYVRVQCN